MPYHELLAEPMARLVGASASASASMSEVVTMNSLTVNLHLMMATFYRPTRSGIGFSSKIMHSPRTTTRSSHRLSSTASTRPKRS